MADPGFPVGGRRPRGGGRVLPRRFQLENFVCQNKRIWTLRGRAPGTPPPRSASEEMRVIVIQLGCVSNLFPLFLSKILTNWMKMHRFERCQSTERRSRGLREELSPGFDRQLNGYSENNSVCKHSFYVTSFLEFHLVDIFSVTFRFLRHNHGVTWFAQNHENCYQILDSHKKDG